jgi:hypothetical protein
MSLRRRVRERLQDVQRPARSGWIGRWPSRLVALALAIAVAATPAAFMAAPAFASPQQHHGWTGYDSSTLLSLTGTILDVQYGNPHVMVNLEVPAEPEEDGTIEDPPITLMVVMAPPFRSESRGLPREMLAPGTVVTYEGYLHRTESMELRAERIIIGDLTVELR